jgi:hypothetical protein
MSPSCKERVTYTYRNTKEELHRANAAIYINKMSQLNHLTPNYIQLTITGNNWQCYKVMYTICYIFVYQLMHKKVALKNIKIYVKTAPTCFGLITVIREHIIWTC